MRNPFITNSLDINTIVNSKKGKTLFSLVIPENCYVTFNNLINLKIKEKHLDYNLTTAFYEGLNLLKLKYPFIDYSENTIRRRYRGGKQKNKIKSISSSVWLNIEDIHWINNYIFFQMTTNIFFLKADFISDLIDVLKESYNTKNQII